jgi:hypothetical protein
MLRTPTLALAIVVAALAAASPAAAKTSWLCLPGAKPDPCTPSLKTTVYSSWGKKTGVVTPKVARKPKVDCFYVYPTVSNQNAMLSTKARDPEIKDIALFQVARYSQVCRVFVPLYRQITVPALERGEFTLANMKIGEADLTAAWNEYLKKYNHGRPFVLIGHSQGSIQLTALIQKQIDKNKAVRKRMLSAILPGGNVTVRDGSDRGGSFQNIPTCSKSTQLGCVIAFSSFNDTPPANAIFGRTTAPGQHVVCTNPAALGGGMARLNAIEPTKPFAPGTLIAAGIQLLHIQFPNVSTPWIEATSAFSGACSTDGGANFLKLTSLPGSPVPTASPDATWGLHLLDANIALGNLVKLVTSETKAYLKK